MFQQRLKIGHLWGVPKLVPPHPAAGASKSCWRRSNALNSVAWRIDSKFSVSEPVSGQASRLSRSPLMRWGPMKWLTMQPAFVLEVPVGAEELMPEIRKAIKDPGLDQHAASAGVCIDFKVPPTERRFWSPHLNVQVGDMNQGAQLHCRYSPRPEVWTMFMAIYLVASCLIFAAAIFGYVQWLLGDSPWALVLIPLLLLVILGLHFASLLGQSWSSDQMDDLRQRLDKTLDLALDGRPVITRTTD